MPEERTRLRRGWKKFDTYHNRKHGVRVQTYVGTDQGNHRGEFAAEYTGDWYQGTTYEEMLGKLTAGIERSSSITWCPLMELRVCGHDWARTATNAGLQLEAERYYIGQRGDGSWAQVDWDIEPERRVVSSRDFSIYYQPEGKWSTEPWKIEGMQTFPLHLASSRRSDDTTHYVPYTEPLWQGVQSVQASLTKLKTHLDALLGSAKGLEKLTTLGSRLLPGLTESAVEDQVRETKGK